MDGLIDLVYSIPVLGLVFQFVGYLIADLPDIAPITLRAAVPIALRRPVRRHVRTLRRRQHRHRGTMLTAAFVGWASGVFLLPILGAGDEIVFGITPALLVALAAGDPRRRCSSPPSMPGSRSPCGRTRSSAARSSTSPPSGSPGYLNTLLAKSSPTGAGAFTAWARRRASGTSRSSAGSSARSSPRDR